MHILFLSTRQAKPSFRFRVEQMLPYFRERGHACDVRFIPQSLFGRLRLFAGLSRFDAVFIQKRLFSQAELFLIRRQSRRLIYDLDDAVMFDGDGRDDGKRRARFRAMMRAADLVICGNQYLAGEAMRDGARPIVIPTCINTDDFHPRVRHDVLARRGSSPDRPVVIGWTGSRSTNRYLNDVLPALASLEGKAVVRYMSDTTDGIDPARLGRVPLTFTPWSPEVEITETAGFDIGLMPLPDDPWTRGKCGFKALQYMGLGIPAVCSPVGVNSDIITHGVNGFLPKSAEEWQSTLQRLVEDSTQRETIGKAGRRRVEEEYALAIQGPRTVHAVEQTVTAARRSA